MIAHVLRRLGCGASAADLASYAGLSPTALINQLLDYERAPDDVDARIGQGGHLGVTPTQRNEPFSPNTNLNDARQRWVFRLVHSRRPLQEKMALFWHNHFATGHSKVAAAVTPAQATKMMAGKPGEIPGSQRGQIETFRQMALGSFRDLLVEVARDPAMLVWLDGRQNTRQNPQENFARELMELFTMGVGTFTEDDVKSAARVFTGWSIRLVGDRADPATSYYEFVFNQGQHDTAAKDFSFPIPAVGGQSIPARAASQGQQDGVDLIDALARHPLTAARLARKLYAFFIDEVHAPDEGLIAAAASAYLGGNLSIRALLQRLLQAPQFLSGALTHTHYSWPAEFVARAIRETGAVGLSASNTLTPMANMGQALYEPRNVSGWATGPAWFSTATTLARMNFAATLMTSQKAALAAEARPHAATPERLLDYLVARYEPAPLSGDAYGGLLEYLRDGGAWTGSDAQVATKTAGLARLIIGSSEYQFS
ncbi:MAG: DUF1800 domain-containing protein [Vicinamibacterales bacterium]|nr:DUF1800 domain-containing protein [Vicinamibacterales bacterium]